MSVLRVENLGVRFELHHQKHTTLTETVVNLLAGRKSQKVQVEDINVFWALRGISFSVEKGEALGIIGKNGAGKSTLLQILTGIYQPDEGTVERHGRIGLLQIGSGFHPELSGRENIFLNGAILGLKKQEIDDLFDDIVAFAELEQFIDAPLKNYSSGMVSRLGFAIAINVKPDILLIDEVLSVGDESFKRKCLPKIEELQKAGKTIIFVSHAMNEVKKICSRVICLDRGRVVFEGESAAAADFYLTNIIQKKQAEAPAVKAESG